MIIQNYRKKIILVVLTITFIILNSTTAFASPTVSVQDIESQIQKLESQQKIAHITATFARSHNYAESSPIIKDSQRVWKASEQKKKELQVQLTLAKNSKFAGTFRLTGYCPCHGCSANWGTQTASGKTALEGITVAADPKVLPLGTKVYIEGVGERIVQDTGGGVKGSHIDIFVNNHGAAYSKEFNAKGAKVWILHS